MAIYIQLSTLTPEGRSKSLEDPGSVLRAQQGTLSPMFKSWTCTVSWATMTS